MNVWWIDFGILQIVSGVVLKGTNCVALVYSQDMNYIISFYIVIGPVPAQLYRQYKDEETFVYRSICLFRWDVKKKAEEKDSRK